MRSGLSHAIALVLMMICLAALVTVLSGATSTSMSWAQSKGKSRGLQFHRCFGLIMFRYDFVTSPNANTTSLDYRTIRYADQDCTDLFDGAQFCGDCARTGKAIVGLVGAALILTLLALVALFVRLRSRDTPALKRITVSLLVIVVCLSGASVAGWYQHCKGKISDEQIGSGPFADGSSVYDGPGLVLMVVILAISNISLVIEAFTEHTGVGSHHEIRYEPAM